MRKHGQVVVAFCSSVSLSLAPTFLSLSLSGSPFTRSLCHHTLSDFISIFISVYHYCLLSPALFGSLSEVARNRVHAAGLEDLVELVLADFTDLSDMGRAVLPQAGSADLVTFSYSLSMIPSKQAALRQAAMLLKDGGFLAVADFFAHGESSFKVCEMCEQAAPLVPVSTQHWLSFAIRHGMDTSITIRFVKPSKRRCKWSIVVT